MSLPQRTEYRLRYLRSEAWSNLRAEALARGHGKCCICGKEDFHNDIHHVWYGSTGKNIVNQLKVLCRRCHKEIHRRLKLETKVEKQCDAHDQFARLAKQIAIDLDIDWGKNKPFFIPRTKLDGKALYMYKMQQIAYNLLLQDSEVIAKMELLGIVPTCVDEEIRGAIKTIIALTGKELEGLVKNKLDNVGLVSQDTWHQMGNTP
jgi:hypothetical protein